MHHIRLRAKAGILEAKLIGYFSIFEVNAYTAAVEPIIQKLAAKGGYRMLLDVTRCAIQSEEVIREFEKHVARVEPARRLAVVTADYIVRMQVRRVLKSPGIGIFVDRNEATVWLDQRRHPRSLLGQITALVSVEDDKEAEYSVIMPSSSDSQASDRSTSR